MGIDEMLEFTTSLKVNLKRFDYKKLTKNYFFQITRSDNFSKMMCRKCCDDTAIAYALKVRCLSTDRKMKDRSEFEQLVQDGLLVVEVIDEQDESSYFEPVIIKTEFDPAVIKTEPTDDSFSIHNEPTEPMCDPIAVKQESVEAEATEVVFITTTTPVDTVGRKVSR